ncbi:MAG: hypothetical protein R2762_21710 [Bryobacteraceae bacterium]
MRNRMHIALPCALLLLEAVGLAAGPSYEYKLLATSKTSTMEKEMNEAAAEGYVFSGVMGGETAAGGNEVVVVMRRASEKAANRKYKLLATSKTSTMEKEMRAAGDEGYAYLGQTVFQSMFGGREVAVIMERDPESAVRREYRLQATSRTSTMEKELNEAGADGFRLLGITVSKTKFGGNELVSILGRDPQ